MTYLLRYPFVSLVIGALVSCVSISGVASAQSVSKEVFDKSGNIYFPPYFLPPSDLASAELKKDYIGNLENSRKWLSLGDLITNGDWTRLYTEYDRLVIRGSYDINRVQYPVDVNDTKIAGVHVDIVKPRGGVLKENRGRVLINLHGGGYIVGSGGMAGVNESAGISSVGGIEVISIDYRQFPQAHYPAASEDVEAVYRDLLKTHKATAIGIYGCSSGGELASAIVPWLLSRGLPKPGAIGVFCAAPLKLGEKGDSFIWGIAGMPEKPFFPIPTDKLTVDPGEQYMSTAAVTDPRAYPGAFNDTLSKFPPTLLLTGTRSLDASVSIAANARLLALGVDSTLYLIEGGWHGSEFVGAPGAPESRNAIKYIAEWFDSRLRR